MDYWKKSEWDKEFRENQVLVCTTQVLLNCIIQKYLSLKDINLLVFDECHHATKKHPMHALMKQFENEFDQKNLPRVIGLTGTLIKSAKESQILDDLNKLEAAFRGKIITVESMDEFKNVLIYSTSPKEVINYWKHAPDNTKPIVQIVAEHARGILSTLKEVPHSKLSKNMFATRLPSPMQTVKSLVEDLLYHLEEFGVYAASISITFVLAELELKRKSSGTSKFREIASSAFCVCEVIKSLLMESIYGSNVNLNARRSEEVERNAILKNSTNKLTSLLDYLLKEFRSKSYNDIKCLVFVQRRYTTKILHCILKVFCGMTMNYIPLKTQFMVGRNQGLTEIVDNLTDEKREKDVMTSFRQSVVNCIICSSVLEEGIDVQECNYVIMLDEMKSFTTYVQTKGRARMQDSYYVIFNSDEEKSQQKLSAKLERFRSMDKLLKNFFTIEQSNCVHQVS